MNEGHCAAILSTSSACDIYGRNVKLYQARDRQSCEEVYHQSHLGFFLFLFNSHPFPLPLPPPFGSFKRRPDSSGVRHVRMCARRHRFIFTHNQGPRMHVQTAEEGLFNAPWEGTVDKARRGRKIAIERRKATYTFRTTHTEHGLHTMPWENYCQCINKSAIMGGASSSGALGGCR